MPTFLLFAFLGVRFHETSYFTVRDFRHNWLGRGRFREDKTNYYAKVRLITGTEQTNYYRLHVGCSNHNYGLVF